MCFEGNPRPIQPFEATTVIGHKIDSYEIIARIGEGGMGVVYRARDTRLGRDVAVKVLPEGFAADADRLARFDREARTLAALNHPNIAHVYGLASLPSSGASAPLALVMELVEGGDLSVHIARGPIPLVEALPLAMQLADALESAHEQGIVHRDLKPANIQLRPDGTVKVLDFGLAKAIDPAGASAVDAMHSPTMTVRATAMGMILGTAAYMAPEQAKGRSVDRRADIWAFDVILCEMLTGRRAFAGDDVTETLASVIRDTPDFDALPADTPRRMRQLIERCLVRDPKLRLRDMGDARIELSAIAASPAAPSSTGRPWCRIRSTAPDEGDPEVSQRSVPGRSTMNMLRTGLCATALVLVSLAALPAHQQGGVDPAMFEGLRWRPIGPMRASRTCTVAGHRSHPYTFYMGVCNGGVWKTTDAGTTWTPIFDEQPSQSIGSIAIAPSDPRIIYVGSGEGLHRPDLSVGDGVYKSTDAGKTWTHLGLREAQQIPEIAVDPRKPDRLFVAVLGHPYGPNPERGIYRSTDGGRTFTQVLTRGENIGARDVDIDPSNPEIVYATFWEDRQGPWENAAWNGTGGGIFKSTDGGTNWRPLTNGLPQGLLHAEITIAPSRPQRLYAIVATAGGRGGGGAGGVFYRSDDGGGSWTKPTIDNRAGNQRVSESNIVVHPRNPDDVIVTDIVSVRSTDGGATWVPFKGAPGGEDYQNGWINPDDPRIMILIADQGAVVTLNDGDTWSSWYNQPTAQMYHIAADASFPYRVCSGQQESGSACVASRGDYGAISIREWQPVGVDEYGYVAPDPRNPSIVFGGRNVTRFDYRSGQAATVGPRQGRADAPAPFRQVRTHPVVFSEADRRTLLFGNNFLWKTTDGGITWRRISDDLTRRTHAAPPSIGTYTPRAQPQLDTNGARVIYTIGPSALDVNRIWVGTDDGVIQTTSDGGLHWTDVTPPGVESYWKVFMIDAGRFDLRTAYAAVNTLRVSDMRPHIYRTHDAGRTWKEIVAGMEEAGPVNAVREDPQKRGLLYASTEKGVYVSFDDGEHWQSLRLNLPASSIRDLIVKDHDLAVATHGRGFWILDDIARLRQMGPSTTAEDVVLFKPADAWRVRWNLSTDMPWPKDEPTLPNPPEGTAIDYYLKAASSGPVTLELLTATGRPVRRYSSADTPAPIPDLSEAPVPLYWYRPPQQLAAAGGMHRFHWDLRYQPVSEGGGGRGGLAIQAVPFNSTPAPPTPLVAPGTYTVKLTVDGRSYTQPLTVKQDPRVPTPAVNLNQLYTLMRGSYFDAAEARAAVDSARQLREGIAERRVAAPDAIKLSLDAFDKRLEQLVGASTSGGGRGGGRGAGPAQSPDSLDAVVAALGALARELGAADVQPTAEQVKSVAAARAAARRVMARWQSLRTTELAAVNAALTKAGLEPIEAQ